jgi:capsular exopolysaccharide synthesis family protein
MGTFFKALEQAERERALKEQGAQRAVPNGAAPVASEPSREASTAPRPITEATQLPLDSSVFQRRVERVEPFQRPLRARDASTPSSPRVDQHLVSLLKPASFGAEQYRALRLKVEQLHRSANLSVVGVTSPEAGDGKTLTAINLAGALAQAPEARVLVVDADLRRSSMTEYLGLEGSRGRGLVGAIFDPDLCLKDIVEPCPPFNLSVVRVGRRPSAPYELLKSPRLGQLLEEARQQYDYVVLDMPPIVPLPDCGVIGRLVDGFLVVVSAHKTTRKLIEEALKALDPATVLGLVFNGDDQPVTGYYGGASRRRGSHHGRMAHDGAQ